MGAAAEKICIYCGQDCSGRPRTKDAQGRYACRVCANARKRRSSEASRAGVTHVEPAVESLGVEDQEAHGRPPRDAPAAADDLFIPADVGEPAPAKAAAEPEIFQVAGSEHDWVGTPPVACPGCGAIMRGGTITCAVCGYDQRTGMRPSAIGDATGKPLAGPSCAKCGYDLTGLRTGKCPECGTRNRPMSRYDLARRDAERANRMEYIRPAIYLAVGAATSIVLQMVKGNTGFLVAYPIGLALTTIIGGVAFYAMSIFHWGLDAPMGLIAVRLAGIFALCDLMSLIGNALGLPFVGWGLRVIVFYALVMKEFDIDSVGEVVAMSIIMQILQAVVVFALLALL